MSGFYVGQRVRRSPRGLKTFPQDRSHTGTVTEVRGLDTGEVYLRIHRDGLRRPDGPYWHEFWEPQPANELTADQAALALARAVLWGDREAARALNDRLTELFSEVWP